MVVMYKFVFWFSTRFGSLLVAGFTLLQSLSILIVCTVWIDDQSAVKDQLDQWLRSYKMTFMTETLEDIRRDPQPYLIGFIMYLSLHCFSVLLLVFGALNVVLWMVYPFLALELGRLLFITVNFVISMLLVKVNIFDLGILIALCCGGGFGLLFLYYLWFCVVSFVQIVKKLESIHNMGHHEGGKLIIDENQHINVPEVGSEYYPKHEKFKQNHQNDFDRNYFHDRLFTKYNGENNFTNVLARPVF